MQITIPLHSLTLRILFWLNKDLLNYELGFFDIRNDWLDEKCGCAGDCAAGKLRSAQWIRWL